MIDFLDKSSDELPEFKMRCPSPELRVVRFDARVSVNKMIIENTRDIGVWLRPAREDALRDMVKQLGQYDIIKETVVDHESETELRYSLFVVDPNKVPENSVIRENHELRKKVKALQKQVAEQSDLLKKARLFGGVNFEDKI